MRVHDTGAFALCRKSMVRSLVLTANAEANWWTPTPIRRLNRKSKLSQRRFAKASVPRRRRTKPLIPVGGADRRDSSAAQATSRDQAIGGLTQTEDRGGRWEWRQVLEECHGAALLAPSRGEAVVRR